MKITLVLLTFCVGLLIEPVWSQDTLILQPGPEGKDACIASVWPEDNFGTTLQFNVMAWTFSGEAGSNRSLMEFDLSQIPAGSEIIDAKFNLYYVSVPPNYSPQTGENESFLQLITEEWDEATITWNTRPSVTSEDQVYLPTSTEPDQDYTDIDVTVPIMKIFNEPENYHGLMCRLISEEYYRCLIFASTDWTDDPGIRPKLVVIYRQCDNPVPSFSYSRDDRAVNFTAMSAAAESWFWDFGDGYSSSLENPVHEYQEKGYYDVCLTVTDSCGTGKYCETIPVCDLPSAGFTYHSEGLTVNFQDASLFSEHYFWSFGDGFYSDLPEPSRTYDTAGYYQVCLITENICGSDTVCQAISVDYSGITEPEEIVFTVSPNPSQDIVSITPFTTGEVTIKMSDLRGQEVLRKKLNVVTGKTIKLPLAQIAPGLYILMLENGKKQAYQKLVVER